MAKRNRKSGRKSSGTGNTINRTFKSTLFIMLFEDKNNLLELYNAMTGKHYSDPELLKINTLKNAIYMSMRNDLSFLIDGRLSLYEHQSTYNPNLPLRFLFYISQLYSGMTKNENLYGTAAVKLPPPEFIIFYNGEKEMPERMVRKLSDLYTVKTEEIRLELETVMLNISGDNNVPLKEACRTLRDYAVYTDKIREYTKTMELEEAVELAIRECLSEGILKEFLEKHRAEAKEMSIFEYNQERHMMQEREAAWNEGREAGRQEGIREGIEKGIQTGIEKGIQKGIQKGMEESLREIVRNMIQQGLSDEQIISYCNITSEELENYKKG